MEHARPVEIGGEVAEPLELHDVARPDRGQRRFELGPKEGLSRRRVQALERIAPGMTGPDADAANAGAFDAPIIIITASILAPEEEPAVRRSRAEAVRVAMRANAPDGELTERAQLLIAAIAGGRDEAIALAVYMYGERGTLSDRWRQLERLPLLADVREVPEVVEARAALMDFDGALELYAGLGSGG